MIFITNLIKIQINQTISSNNEKSLFGPGFKTLLNGLDYWQTR